MKNLAPAALVTGASSGIGLELAKCLAADGYRLILVARDKGRLQAAADSLSSQYGVATLCLAHDLAEDGTVAAIMGEVERAGWPVEVLINNAGFGIQGPFADTELEKQLSELATNVVALTELTHRVLQAMRTRKSGHILNVGSVAGFLPGPLMATYYASKAYVVSFSQALSDEVRGSGITVTCLCPGATDTNFSKRAGLQGSLLEKGSIMGPERVAQVGYGALKRGKTLAVPGLFNSAQVFFLRFSPRGLAAGIARRLNAK